MRTTVIVTGRFKNIDRSTSGYDGKHTIRTPDVLRMS